MSMGTERPRVLFLDHETRLSGGQQDLRDLIAALDPARAEVHVALPGGGELTDSVRSYARIHYLRLSERVRRMSRWRLSEAPLSVTRILLGMIAGSVRILGLVRRLHPDVVQTNSMKLHFLAIVPCKVTRTPLIWHVRDILEKGWLRSLLVSVGRWGPERIVCISEAVAEPFRAHPTTWQKVRIVYNGIHLESFQKTAAGWRRRLGAKNGFPLIGMVAQIARWKGQDVFIEAAARLADRMPNARFAIVGECLFPENETEFFVSLRERAQRLGLSERLSWPGWVDDIPSLMSALDVLVHPSRMAEPFGRVLVEAMAAGTPVVGSKIGAIPEVVTRDAGRLVAPGDSAALAEALYEILADPKDRRRMSRAAKDAARRFDISDTAHGVMEVWAEVLS